MNAMSGVEDTRSSVGCGWSLDHWITESLEHIK